MSYDIEKNFSEDYKFLLEYEKNVLGRDFISDNARFLLIIDRYESLNTTKGKFFWLVGHAYYYLQRKQYRQGVLNNFEKYLTLEPFEENYKDTLIPLFNHKAKKLPNSKEELEFAKKIHYRDVYYLLAKTYQQENILDKAMLYLKKGMEIVLSEKIHFYWELYEVCRKQNNLPLFLQYCDQLSQEDIKSVDILIQRAKTLIERGYTFKARNKKCPQ